MKSEIVHEVMLEEAPDQRQRYGIRFLSEHGFTVRGKNVHNPAFPHRVTVWNNEHRPNTNPDRHGDGRYVDPDGQATNDAWTVYLSAESIVIAAEPVQRAALWPADLHIGDAIILRFPDGQNMTGTIQARVLYDPIIKIDQPI